MNPDQAMRLALAQARRAQGRTCPNPAVGAVIFRGDRVLGRGHTRPPGGPHAEVVALESARRRHGAARVRGASLAVTLEPCGHHGRTGPCADVIRDAGIARVFVGVSDPSPHARGRGIRRLRAAGVRVERGVLADECRTLHRGFLSLHARGRPFVTLKLAASLDGRIATASGESRWISGPEARRAVHRLRERSDAVAVGAETALTDDPELTARRGRRIVHRPVRVLFDTRLRVPAAARLYAGASDTISVCGTSAAAARRRRIEATGARVLPVRLRDGRIDLRTALAALGRAGLTTLLVEGGGRLAASLLAADLVDELHWITAPKLIGGDGMPALASLGVKRLLDARGLAQARLRRVGGDLWLTGRPGRLREIE